ncbi:MAG: tRNA uridine-5-carboxymethylaminomethyl(34) synthesis GTPase MnmE [Candidatus Omnitrophota bacterium]|jgi:tRNA modification GTPase
MLKDNLTDTIAAISTPVGEGGIGIVRLSGKDALKIADKIFVSKDGKKPSTFVTYTVHYGWIVARQETGIIDEVLLTVMRSPRSFTKEDIVEINCHGGIIATRAVLERVLEGACRLAEPGEFTKRAFLNGRIDLAQAEAVLDVIRAKTDGALKLGLEQLKGGLSKEINKIRSYLLDALAALEADIDFPEEGSFSLETPKIYGKLKSAQNDCKKILENARRGQVFREGIHVVICGRPNVGKSSLLNALLKTERSIVTPVAGTTRDTVEEIIDIKGIPVRIVDTAGILEPRDLIEKKAVEHSKKHIAAADLVILMFDASKQLAKDDLNLIKKLSRKNCIAVINKIDLNNKIKSEKITKIFRHTVALSAKKNKNIDLLEEAIADLIYRGEVFRAEYSMVSNLRHITALRHAQKLIAEALNSLDNKLPPEFISQDIKEAMSFIDDILGKTFTEDLLDKIFSDFCIGK